MIAAGNRSGYNKTNLEEHRRLAMLFFLPGSERIEQYILIKKEKQKREVRICYSSHTEIY